MYIYVIHNSVYFMDKVWHLSLTSRNMVYIPEDLSRELGISAPSKIRATVRHGKLVIESLQSIAGLAGTLKEDK